MDIETIHLFVTSKAFLLGIRMGCGCRTKIGCPIKLSLNCRITTGFVFLQSVCNVSNLAHKKVVMQIMNYNIMVTFFYILPSYFRKELKQIICK